MSELRVIPIHDIGEVRPGDDLAELIAGADDADLRDGDCLVITQKVVSKAEGRLVEVDPEDPLSHKPLVERESVRILRRRGELIISETRCLEIMGEKLSKKQACNMTSKHKLVEASLKEKDYDPYFSICIVLQGARNTFMREVQRHIDCYCDNVESMNAQNAARRTYKNMNDTHHVRRVKLFRDTKIDKYYKLSR